MEAEHGPTTGELPLMADDHQFEIFHAKSISRAYLVADPETRDAAIVDPIRERVDDYVAYLERNNLTLRYAVETHSHEDHLPGSVALAKQTGAKVAAHAETQLSQCDRVLADGMTLKIGSVSIEVLATPGHTRDSISLRVGNRLLSGDTLGIGTVAAVDLPTSSSTALYDSIQRLCALPDETMVFPTHVQGAAHFTTIGREKEGNPQLSLDRDAFIESL